MISLAADSGFFTFLRDSNAEIEVVDTSADYRTLCDAEYAQMKGPLRDRMAELLGAETRDHFVENWRAMTVVLHQGELRTGRVRARKP